MFTCIFNEQKWSPVRDHFWAEKVQQDVRHIMMLPLGMQLKCRSQNPIDIPSTYT